MHKDETHDSVTTRRSGTAGFFTLYILQLLYLNRMNEQNICLNE